MLFQESLKGTPLQLSKASLAPKRAKQKISLWRRLASREHLTGALAAVFLFAGPFFSGSVGAMYQVSVPGESLVSIVRAGESKLYTPDISLEKGDIIKVGDGASRAEIKTNGAIFSAGPGTVFTLKDDAAITLGDVTVTVTERSEMEILGQRVEAEKDTVLLVYATETDARVHVISGDIRVEDRAFSAASLVKLPLNTARYLADSSPDNRALKRRFSFITQALLAGHYDQARAAYLSLPVLANPAFDVAFATPESVHEQLKNDVNLASQTILLAEFSTLFSGPPPEDLTLPNLFLKAHERALPGLKSLVISHVHARQKSLAVLPKQIKHLSVFLAQMPEKSEARASFISALKADASPALKAYLERLSRPE